MPVLFFAFVSTEAVEAKFCSAAAKTKSSKCGQQNPPSRCQLPPRKISPDPLPGALQVAELAHGGAVMCMCEQRRALLTGCGDGRLRIFDSGALREVSSIAAHDGGVRAIAIQARHHGPHSRARAARPPAPSRALPQHLALFSPGYFSG